MGTDIHMIVQRRETPEHPWETVALSYDCPDCNATGKQTFTNRENVEAERDCYWCNATGKCPKYRDRNYDMFAQLASVRNGTGFAGCDLGEGFVPVAQPRGLPEGVHPAVEYDDEGEPLGLDLGDHSFSWLTLAELLTYDIDRTTVKRGVVDRKTWEQWDRKGSPGSYCGDVWGQGIVIVSDREAIAGKDSAYVRCSWGETYRESGGVFWERVLPNLQRIGHPDCVRIVFGFDS